MALIFIHCNVLTGIMLRMNKGAAVLLVLMKVCSVP